MNILFLDLDGVLNSDTWRLYATPEQRRDQLDPLCVQLFASLIAETDIHWVLSSDWRYGIPLNNILATLVHWGYPESLLSRCLGATPILKEGRCAETLTWLSGNLKTTAWVSLDDKDFGLPAGHLVRTDEEVGLTRVDVEQVKATLASQSDPMSGFRRLSSFVAQRKSA